MVPPPVALLEPSDGRPRYRAYYVSLRGRPARVRIGSTQGGMTMTELHILCDGYVREGDDLRVGSTVGFVRDGEALIVIDPGMVASVSSILEPLAALGVAPGDVTDVVLSHHHPDHTVNVALFPRARVHDHWAVYDGDLWTSRDADGVDLSPSVRLLRTP